MHQARYVGDVEQAILDGNVRTSSVHRFVELERAVAVPIVTRVLAHRGRIGMRTNRAAGVGVPPTEPQVRQRLAIAIVYQRWADVAAVKPLTGIDAPDAAGAFTVLGILTHGDVHL